MSAAGLNPEPADPQERKENHLPPKSYADAVEESPGTNGAVNGVEHIEDAKRPGYDRQESSHEYSAQVCAPSVEKGSRAQWTDDEVPGNRRHAADADEEEPPKAIAEHERRRRGGAKDEWTVNVEFSCRFCESLHWIAADEMEDFKDEEHDILLLNGRRSHGRLATVKQDIQNSRIDEKPKPRKREETLQAGKKAGQRWSNSAIRFAPLNVPLQRRLQTLTVLFHTLSIAMGAALFFFLCAIPLFWPLLIPYMIYSMASQASVSTLR